VPLTVQKITTFQRAAYDIAGPTATSTFTLSSKTAKGGYGIVGRFQLRNSMLAPYRTRRQVLFDRTAYDIAGPTATSTFTLSSKTAKGGYGILGRHQFRASMLRVVFDVAMVPDGIASGFAAGTPIVLPTQILSPGGIASGFAAGTAFLKVPLTTTGIASGFAAGTPFVAPSWIVAPGGIPTSFAAGNQLVAPTQQLVINGDIFSGVRIGVPLIAGGNPQPAGIPSSFAAGDPSVFETQLVAPSGVPTSFAAGLPLVRLVQTIQTPTGIASGVALGHPAVNGAVQRVIVSQSIGPPDIGIPRLNGGRQSLQCFIAGVDVTDFFRVEIAAVASQTIGRWTFTFDLFTRGGADLSWIQLGHPVLVQEFGVKVFAGCIADIVAVPTISTPGAIFYHITANDKTGICDHRLVAPIIYPAAADAADVIRAVRDSSLNGEGITTNGVPASLGALGADLPINWESVTSVYDRIATSTGTVWWVDINGDLHFSSLVSLEVVPFEITDTSGNYRNLSVRQTLQDYLNRQVVVSNLTVVPEGSGAGASGPVTTETYVFGPNGQQAAFNAGLAFGYILLSLPLRAIVSFKINGLAKLVYSINDAAAPAYGSVEAWYYFGSPQGGGQMLFPGFLDVHNGDTVEIQYVPLTQSSAVTEGDALDPSIPPGATLKLCGSGRYEAAEQVKDISLRSDLEAIARALLDRKGGIPTIVSFEFDFHGAAPGKLVRVDRPDVGVSNRMLMITSVSGKAMFAELGPGNRCSFRWTVTARSNHDPGNTLKWTERLVRRTEQARPIIRDETASWVISPDGSAIANGVPLGNPRPVKRTGRLTELTIQTGVTSVDQDLTVTLFNGSGAALGQVTLPAAAAIFFQFTFLFGDSNPIYVFGGDNLSIQAVTRDTGPSPSPASNITFTASWEY